MSKNKILDYEKILKEMRDGGILYGENGKLIKRIMIRGVRITTYCFKIS